MPAHSDDKQTRVLTRPPAEAVVEDLIAAGLVPPDGWDALPEARRESLVALADRDAMLTQLTEAGLLTPFQASRLRYGNSAGLVLGNYRLLDRLGAGGMATVYRGEHVRLRQPVAVKVVTLGPEQDPRFLTRFYAETRHVARLAHPHIVHALDAGEVRVDGTPWHYLVMEYVPGRNLEDLVLADGPLPVARACALTHHVADGLHAAHAGGLVHRDIKPSNVMVTPDWVAKLLDFGLARSPGSARVTDPGSLLGTLGYVSPEQVRDPTNVDARADLFGLGCTLYWALTGQDPYPSQGTVVQDLLRRTSAPAPSARALRPELPTELDRLLRRLMDPDPAQRYPTAQALMGALYPFWDVRNPAVPAPVPAAAVPAAVPATPPGVRRHRLLVVDDEASVRRMCVHALQADTLAVAEVADGTAALDHLSREGADLVLLDVDMPGVSGVEVLRHLRAAPEHCGLKVIMLSGRSNTEDLSRLLLDGADDFLPKPFSVVELRARVRASLRLKDAQDRAERLARNLLSANAELERSLGQRDGDLLHARGALVMGLARLVEQRLNDSTSRLVRLQRYARLIAGAAQERGSWSGLNDEFVRLLEDAIPLHDIGRVALPDHILLKPGRLEPEERLLMQAHTTIGAEMLEDVSRTHPFAGGFFQMAIDIARHHHERWDGTGYPDRLAGTDIPLAARVAALADVYDALRSRRVYKPGLSHPTAVAAIVGGSPGQFDPQLVSVFEAVAPQMERVYRDMPN